jgi:hypothetical protein
MKSQFISYEQALTLKELGFDQECLGVWDNQTRELFLNDTRELSINDIPTVFTLAPLYQQAFNWIRTKYNLANSLYSIEDKDTLIWNYRYWYLGKNITPFSVNRSTYYFDEYREAEIACLNKLIELCKRN